MAALIFGATAVAALYWARRASAPHGEAPPPEEFPVCRGPPAADSAAAGGNAGKDAGEDAGEDESAAERATKAQDMSRKPTSQVPEPGAAPAPLARTAEAAAPPPAQAPGSAVRSRAAAPLRAAVETATPPSGDEAAHELAVKLARTGDNAQALAILTALAEKEPGNLAVIRDELAVLAWAGRQAEAAALFARLPPGQPAYVLSAAGRAYRDLKRWPQALKIYAEGRRRFPGEPDFAAGEILVLTDMGDAVTALSQADAALQRRRTLPVLMAAGYAAMALDQPVEALRRYDQALELAPQDKEAARARILAIERMGAPHQALALAEASPGLVTDEEQHRLEGSDAAELVRFGSLEPESEAKRFAVTDAAIARLDALIAHFAAAGDAAKDDLMRARLDRMIAYRDRARMADLVREYEGLSAEKVDLPPYALEAAADAYLYLREPEQARALYERALEREGGSFTPSLGLFYSLVELEELDKAVALIDKLDAAQSKWLWLKGGVNPLPNPARETADLAAASARLYADELPRAEAMTEALVDAAPANPAFLMSLASVYRARGWPGKAQEEYDVAAALAPNDPALAADEGSNALALQDYERAAAEASDLMRRYPERRDAQRLAEAWDIHERPELTISLGKTFESATSVAGGNGVAFDGHLFSAPILYQWRAFAGEYIAEQETAAGEENYFRHAAGLEWRSGPLTAAAEASLNSYGSDKPGAALSAAWALDDQWHLDGKGELFAKDTPLPALKAGVTADEGSGTLTWRESESRAASLTAAVMGFSDGNLRPSLDGHYSERLWSEPHLSLDGTAELATSASTRSNTSYYSPRHDLLPVLGFEAVQVLYRRYELSWQHELSLSAGGYWEERFGTSPAATLAYRHRLKLSEAFEIAAGFELGSQTYDGQRVDSLTLTLSLSWRPEL